MTFWCWASLLVCLGCLVNKGESVNVAGREDIQRVDVTEGDTLSLTCRAKSNLLRGYRWVYIREGTRKPRVLSSGRRLVVGEPRLSIDAKPIEKDVNLILNLKEIRPYEAGLFMCWRQGLKPDPQVYVRVLEVGTEEAEPVSVQISSSTHVRYGGSVTITCLITPSWPGKIIWLENNRPIIEADRHFAQKVDENSGGELSASLEIVSARESANYTCKVPSLPPAKASVLLTVKVAKIESLTATPKSDAIEYGERFTVECIVAETDSEVLWLKDGETLKSGNSVRYFQSTQSDGRIRSILEILNFSMENNGQYMCYVPGDSKFVLVNVEGRPPIIIGLKGWDFLVGDVLRLSCSVQYNKLKREITWLFEGEPFRENWYPEFVIREDKHNITHHDLSLPIPTSQHVGTYTCTAAFGSASTQVREIVPPYSLEHLEEEMMIKEKSQLKIPCSIIGYPVPFAAWEKLIDSHWRLIEEAATEGHTDVEGTRIAVDALTEERASGEEKVGEKAVLHIEHFLPKHEGKYRCRGSNDDKEVVFETTIRMKDPVPEVIHVSSDPVVEGGDLIITCTVINAANETVIFEKGIYALGQGDNLNHKLNLVYDDESIKESTYALTIEEAQIEDSGAYKCSAGSEAHAFIEAVVKPAQPEIVEIAASPAVENGEIFVSCTIENIFTDNEAEFYFEGRNLNTEKGAKYSTHLAESKGESVVDSRPRSKVATYVLKVRDAKAEDSGLYRCVLGAQQDSVLVNVEALSNVEEVLLEAATAWYGAELKLTCTVINWDGEVSFFHNTTMLLEEEDPRYYLSKKEEGNTTIHILTIFDATFEDSGQYQCFSSPFVSSIANVTVKDSDHISLTLVQAPVNSSIMLTCTVDGFGNHEHTVEISHDGRPFLYVETSEIGVQVNPRVIFVPDPQNSLDTNAVLSYQILLKNVEESDAGLWACRATLPDAGLVLEDSTKVQVFIDPEFIDLPEQEYAPHEGDDLVINCSAKGLPIPDIVWYRAEEDIPIVNKSASAQLILSPVSDEDAGSYTCVASSVNMTISTQSIVKITKRDKIVDEIELTIPKDHVTIVEMPRRKLQLEMGSSVDLRCVANGTASPFVMWLKEGYPEVLASGHDYVIYSIDSFSDSDAGKYVCKATYEGEETSDFTELVIIESIHPEIAAEPNLASIGTTQSPPESLATSPSSTATFPPVIPTLMTGKLINLSGPDMTELDSEFTLLCLVSPLLLKFKYLITFNEDLLTMDDQLVSYDSRMSIVTGVGPFGETMVGLKIRNTKESDGGYYKCTGNTVPAASDDHYIKVVARGHLSTLESTVEDVTDIPTTDVLSTTTITPATETEKDIPLPEFTLDTFKATTTISAITEAKIDNYDYDDEYRSGTNDDYDDKVTIPTSFDNITEVSVGETASLLCLSYILEDQLEPVYFWYFNTRSGLLTAGSTLITSNQRISVTYDRILDEASSTLTITNVTEEDAGIYGCSLSGKELFTYEQELSVFYFDDSILYEENISSNNEEVTTEKSPETTADDFVTEEEFNSYMTENRRDNNFHVPEDTTTSSVFTTTEEYHVTTSDSSIPATEIVETEIPTEELEMEISVTESSEELDDPHTEEELEHVENTSLDENEHIPLVEEKQTPLEEDSKNDKSIEEEDHIMSTEKEDTSEITTLLVEEDQAHPVPEEERDTEDTSHILEEDQAHPVPEGEDTEDNNHILEEDQAYPVPEEERDTEDTSHNLEEDQTHPVPEKEGDTDDISHILEEDPSHPVPEEESDTEDISLILEEDQEYVYKDYEDRHIPFVEITEYDHISSTEIEAKPEETTETNEQHIEDHTETSKEKNLEEHELEEPIGTINVVEEPEIGKEYHKENITDEDYTVTDHPDVDNEDSIEEVEYYPDGDSEEYYDEDIAPEPLVIVAVPGEDVETPADAVVILPCPTNSTAEDITWKDTDTDQLLFLGSLDLAGVEGLALSPEGKLKLLSDVVETKKDKTYTCLVFDYDINLDVKVTSFKINLIDGNATPVPKSTPQDNSTVRPPTATYEFPGLEWQEVAVVSNSKIAGESLVQVLKEGGIKAQLSSYVACADSSSINGWQEAQKNLKNCESESRSSGLLRKDQSVFIILDFSVTLPSTQRYGSTLIYVHNKARKLKSHVFGPLVPVAKNNEDAQIECGSPMESSPKGGLDLSEICKSWIASTILNLQETYLSHSRQLPMVKK